MWFLFVISAKLHGWKWIIHAAENKSGGVIKRLMEFSANQSIRNMSDEVYEQTRHWVDEHFIVIDNSENYTYVDLLLMAENLIKEKQYQGLLIDPYNSLHREKDRTENVHDYDYQAMGDMRLWIRKHNCCIYINTHAQTEALRRTYPMNHAEYAGMPMPPNKADTEGGGKFSNRADDFLTIHRMTQHATKWMFSEIHVRKIKEMETGGRPTSFDKPFIVQMGEGGCGFHDMSGYNPIKPCEKFYSTKPLNFYESTKEQNDDDFLNSI